MKRVHLFEFEDLSWFPKNIRNYMTDFLQFVSNILDCYQPIVPLLKKALEKSRETQIIDLASGGGGGLKKLSNHLQEEIPNLQIILTDYYPNIPAFSKTVEYNPHVFSYETESVNALNVPKKLKGFRTQFLSFHHFKEKEALQILQNAVDHNVPIGLFEAQKRDWAHLLKFLLTPLNVWVLSPFIRPFKFGRLLFTYLIPIVPFLIFWDGMVSVMRTYSVEELQSMKEKLNRKEDYYWEIGEVKNNKVTITYLLAYPKNQLA